MDRMDIVSPKVRSKIMAAVKSKNTSLERFVFAQLKKKGIRFKAHYNRVPGTPDVALPSHKKAIFIDGDFWHGFRFPAWKKTIKSKFWRDKIESNRQRDLRTFRKLRRLGWKVLRIWGHEIHNDPSGTMRRVREFVSRGNPRKVLPHASGDGAR
jgi:DNA mismatch endonuclease (patch repair protein)